MDEARRSAPLLLLLLGACMAPVGVDELSAPTGPLPERVAVLPPAAGGVSEALAAMLRIRLGNAFEQRGYAKLDDAWFDQRLTHEGVGASDDAALCALCRRLDVDGCVLLEDFGYRSMATGVYNDRRLAGRCRVLDARTGATAWTVTAHVQERGGLLLQSGQLADALQDTVDGAGTTKVDEIACKLALAIAAKLPPNPHPSPVRRRPVVRRFAATRGPTDGEWNVELDGSADCLAYVSLPDGIGRRLLDETAPGCYRGIVPAPRGAAMLDGGLRDRMGASSRIANATLDGSVR